MFDPHQQLETLKLIDQRQQQVLEDLEALNARIENIIELYQANRQNRGSEPASDRQDAA